MRRGTSFSIFLFFLLASFSSFGQDILLKGIVFSNKEKLPVAFASIQLTGMLNIVDCDENRSAMDCFKKSKTIYRTRDHPNV